jgi:ElaB/YqjD/DUF883 family membrane-anchored ribosome-binding protein
METIGRSTTGINEMDGTIGRTVDHTASNVHKAIDKAADAARPAVDNVAAGAHQSVDRIAGTATLAADALAATGGQLIDAQSRFTESCRTQVREKPMTSLAVAIAAGFLLSWLIGRR